MDPQHVLALQLAKEMFEDAGPETMKLLQARRERVGVYVGAWQEVSNGKTGASAYHTIGASMSALAARVANAYDLQGPAMTINTACSSALVAVHEALKDAKAGRIDFAIVGGVNLFGEDLQLFQHLRRAGMLSPSGRCHTFSAEADGYVRGEGGALFLLAREELQLPSHGCILGSAVTQNSRQCSKRPDVGYACHDLPCVLCLLSCFSCGHACGFSRLGCSSNLSTGCNSENPPGFHIPTYMVHRIS